MSERSIYDWTKAVFEYFGLPFDSEPLPAPARQVFPQPMRGTAKIGRNDSCPCGSGMNYNKRCGKG